MAQTPVEMTKDLTLTLIKTGRLSADVMQDTLQQTYATLTALKVQEEVGTSASVSVSPASAVNWRKSIRKHAITCLECGLVFKQVSLRHLLTHGLDSRSYRTKHGIPWTQPLTARATTERRRQVVRETRPWEKTPMYRKGQARNGTASPEAETEAVHEEAEEPSVVAPVQPRRQRGKQILRRKPLGSRARKGNSPLHDQAS
jgi:predicted transcriptional regulator